MAAKQDRLQKGAKAAKAGGTTEGGGGSKGRRAEQEGREGSKGRRAEQEGREGSKGRRAEQKGAMAAKAAKEGGVKDFTCGQRESSTRVPLCRLGPARGG